MRKLTHFLFFFGTLAAFAGCSSGDDSLGRKANNSNQSKCSGPNPATLGCGAGNTCPSGMVCDSKACHSSHCSCDEATGGWQCTADCGTPTCVPEGSGPTCEARDPSLGCSGGCPTGTVCNPDACAPGSCTCEDNGEWRCTRDCGGRGACVPDPGQQQCTGPNPALGCGNGCPSGTVCSSSACRPSSCSCDAARGSWICTDDCGSGGTCVPEPKACTGPNPATGCENGCADGTVCDYGACRSSSCFCDPATGNWGCTADCGSGGTCVPEGSASCNGTLGKRAPEGDALCAGKPDCSTQGSAPDDCTCFHNLCFTHS